MEMSNTDLDQFLDVEFYSKEANLTSTDAKELTEHFLKSGRLNGLSPHPLILWPWIEAQLGADVISIEQIISEGGNLHPIFDRAALMMVFEVHGGDFTGALRHLSTLCVQEAPVHSLIKTENKYSEIPLLSFATPLSQVGLSDQDFEFSFFDSRWYNSVYSDVSSAKKNPFIHFMTLGYIELRDPSPEFSTSRYYKYHPDVEVSRQNPLFHYWNCGYAEGRKTAPTDMTTKLVMYRSLTGSNPPDYVDFYYRDDQVSRFASSIEDCQLCIVTPFYRKPGLIQTLCSSIVACEEEILRFNVLLVLVNDSPQDLSVGRELEYWRKELEDHRFKVVVITNTKNLGFIQSSNIGLAIARHINSNCLLLNSDARLTKGCIGSMMSVLTMDDKFGFVNPFSDNATISTFGLNLDNAHELYRSFLSTKDCLPRFYIVPTVVGFCMLVRAEVIQLFGYLDAAYGKGYNEENDYVMRANRKGFVSVIDTQSFVFHEGEQSFSVADNTKLQLERKNAEILDSRYPEFRLSVSDYFLSSYVDARRLVEGYAFAYDVLVDLSDVRSTRNGTSHLAKALVPRLLIELQNLRVAIVAKPEVTNFLGITPTSNLQIFSDMSNVKAKVGFKPAQPFSSRNLSDLRKACAYLGFMMLDTIAGDCLYLKDPRTSDLWYNALAFADLVVYISEYTKEKVNNRYDLKHNAVQLVSYCSLDPEEYLIDDDVNINVPSETGRFCLVIGNSYEHKALNWAIRLLSDMEFFKVIVGSGRTMDKSLCLAPGAVSATDMNLLFSRCKFIVFPSIYEGFGMPLLEAAAYNKPILVHDCSMSREIWTQLHRTPLMHFFDSAESLKNQYDALVLLPDQTKPAKKYKENNGWSRSAREIARSLESFTNKAPRYKDVLQQIVTLSPK